MRRLDPTRPLATRLRSLVAQIRTGYASRLAGQGIADVWTDPVLPSWTMQGVVHLRTRRGDQRSVEVGLMASRYEITFRLLLSAQNLWLLDVLRHGTRQEVDEAFQDVRRRDEGGWRTSGRRPCPERAATSAWWSVLGVSRHATTEEVLVAWKALAKTHHPDHGGSHDVMAAVNDAKDRALAILSA